MTVTLRVNGQDLTLPDDANATLQFALRDDLGLTGTKFGCGMGQCGCCTVLVDGEPTRSCVTQVSSVLGKSITTIEGLAPAGRPTRSVCQSCDACRGQEQRSPDNGPGSAEASGAVQRHRHRRAARRHPGQGHGRDEVRL
jgi:xanthine dehydrogenase iron-sulfur cluster and FAD-binding subunit A